MEWTPIDEHTTRIFMIRHGEVENHDQGVFNGQLDVDITPRGVGHMERAAEFLAAGGGGRGGGGRDRRDGRPPPLLQRPPPDGPGRGDHLRAARVE